MKKALIGMSGGVDSSVAAYLALQQGLSCIGATMRLWDKNPDGSISRDAEDARLVADRLGIPHYIIDYRQEFLKNIVEPFIGCYEQGKTPNPCILCNETMKFGLMLDKALELGCQYVISGHYARIRQENGRYVLCRAADRTKDQTYFLYGLTQHQLSHALFPLGELTKAEARDIAQQNGLITARKRDSQDICFIPGGDYVAFMEGYTHKTYPSGDFLDACGKVVGCHRGAPCYTIGQRRGLGLAMGEPVYVCCKDMENNTVTVGPNSLLFHNGLRAEQMNWMAVPALTEPLAVSAKIRHSQYEQSATVYPEDNGSVRVVFDEPQRAITPGQSVVLYLGDMVLGGGIIREALDI